MPRQKYKRFKIALPTQISALTMIDWILEDTPHQPMMPFPPLKHALNDPNGLLCAGGSLLPERLLLAYQQGIFPWFSEGEPILWWSPDPRMVLFPEEFRCSRSLGRALKKQDYQIRLDYDFSAVIGACAGILRKNQKGTWIVGAMRQAYLRLHELGWAHSVEVWMENEGEKYLAGGLYGMAIGRVFFGESMFSHRTDASKIAFAFLVHYLKEHGFGLIDCQVHSAHLASLGAREIPRAQFSACLDRLCAAPLPGRWEMGGKPFPPENF